MEKLRFREIKILLYRIFLVYIFYQISRFSFWFFNRDLIKIDDIWVYFKLSYYGIAFDTTAILYTNSLFILLSIIPTKVNTTKMYQKILFWIYFFTNGIAYLINFGDIIYFRFSQMRLTSVVLSVVENEHNLNKVLLSTLVQNFILCFLFILFIVFWMFLYRKVRILDIKTKKGFWYFFSSVVLIIVVTILSVGGIRGDFKHSTRPINLVDANRHISNPIYANVILNSTFSFLRTLNTNGFKKVNYVDENIINQYIHPYKIYERKNIEKCPNIVIFIVESLGREYIGAFNKDKNIPRYISHTPFLDSLSGQSLIFLNMFANGRQSIHGMSSILAGIPALKDAFTSSPYSNQEIQSLVSVCKELGYDTSFYHGAPNGSMGFLGFSHILGFDHYFGKTEYNNDKDFDGIWSIWDEPFLQYFAKNMVKNKPFLATVFTASSHHPFKIPSKYQSKFKKGPLEIHQPIEYTDYALKKYFETAKKQPWFGNTIFVITGDHTNQTYYDEYKKQMNRFAVPLILYSPNPEYHLKGINQNFAQQIDVYPTIADLIGYHKPLRSWGRSLVSDKKEDYIIVNSDGVEEQFIIGNHIYRFDGKNITGVYALDDLGEEKDLKKQINEKELKKAEITCRAWYQDYMEKIIDRKLRTK